MQARQKLMVEFCDYPQMLVTNFTKCIKDPHKSAMRASNTRGAALPRELCACACRLLAQSAAGLA